MIYVAWALFLFAAYIAILNAAAVVASHRNYRDGIDKHYSTVPLITIIIGAMSSTIFVAIGSEQYSKISWVPAILDIGNWGLLFGAVCAIGSGIKGIFQRDADT